MSYWILAVLLMNDRYTSMYSPPAYCTFASKNLMWDLQMKSFFSSRHFSSLLFEYMISNEILRSGSMGANSFFWFLGFFFFVEKTSTRNVKVATLSLMISFCHRKNCIFLCPLTFQRLQLLCKIFLDFLIFTCV